MEKVRPWCGQPSDRGRLRNRTEHLLAFCASEAILRLRYVTLRYWRELRTVWRTRPSVGAVHYKVGRFINWHRSLHGRAEHLHFAGVTHLSWRYLNQSINQSIDQSINQLTLMVQTEQSVRCVSLSRTITFKPNDLWPRYLACWFNVTLSRSGSKVKSYVKDHGHKMKTSFSRLWL